ncbi:MAG: UDP-N-acetylglucosamine--N-acetylmuramyl-(pentapeptide) pyrophosphoryl-undecaprenol N-acetylglucosamine transferase [Planctomycetota bacterium]|nr:UDP-N-acetylglucosamine--N-acetylmuramyl-(pentapeptide) pyrophosphoryl-undecaprenol N-acetylglucosamine transferase [Planctomycetota bacterium]
MTLTATTIPRTRTTPPELGASVRSSSLRVAFVGGGTGGHVVPGLHLLAAARATGRSPADLVWFTSGRPVEERVFGGAAALLADLSHERVVLPLERAGGGAPSRAQLVLRAPAAVVAARRALVAHKSHVLLGLGGFTSLPAVVAARGLGIPVALLEVNAVPGAATRWLGRISSRTLHGFASSASRSPRNVHTGPPLPPEMTRGAPDATRVRAARASLGFDPDRPVLLVLGGSQGASALNGFVRANLSRLHAGGVQVLHQTGPGKLAEAAVPVEAYRAVEYLDPVRTALEAATVVLCRAGASTLCEVAALRIPAFVAPYPRAADDHQTRNALELGTGVRVVNDMELGAWTADAITRLASESGARDRSEMSAALERALPLDGAQRIWDELHAVARVAS